MPKTGVSGPVFGITEVNYVDFAFSFRGAKIGYFSQIAPMKRAIFNNFQFAPPQKAAERLIALSWALPSVIILLRYPL